MLQWLLRGLMVSVFRLLFVVAAAPIVLLAATPFIFLREWILALRNKETFKVGVMDAYGCIWDSLVAALHGRFTATSIGSRALAADHLTDECEPTVRDFG